MGGLIYAPLKGKISSRYQGFNPVRLTKSPLKYRFIPWTFVTIVKIFGCQDLVTNHPCPLDFGLFL